MKQEIDSLLPGSTYDRRCLLTTATAAGFALAVQPVSAQTMIVTDGKGLAAGDIKIPTSSGDIPGYRAMPEAGGPFPAILVVQEIFGVHENQPGSQGLEVLDYGPAAPAVEEQGD